MSNWEFLENILSGVNKYPTVIGCIWLSIVFSILVYVAAAEHVWKDENKDFACNIQQPGCENMCFDHFFPISACGPSSSSWCPLPPFVSLHVAYRENRERRHGKKLYEDKGRIDRGLLCTYVISLVFKTTFEVGSLLAFYFLNSGFDVPRLLRCSLDSCPNTVDYYTAKATEIFLYIMGCTSILCIVLNVSKMVYILSKQCWKCFSKHYIPIEERASRHCPHQQQYLSPHLTKIRWAHKIQQQRTTNPSPLERPTMQKLHLHFLVAKTLIVCLI